MGEVSLETVLLNILVHGVINLIAYRYIYIPMCSIDRMLFLALKKVRIVKTTPPQVLTTR